MVRMLNLSGGVKRFLPGTRGSIDDPVEGFNQVPQKMKGIGAGFRIW